jgi:hypothetical protein
MSPSFTRPFESKAGITVLTLLIATIAIVAFPTSGYSKKDPPVKITVPTKLSETVKVYKGGQGFKVVIVRGMPYSEKSALIKISGTDTEMDDTVFAAAYDENVDSKFAFYTIHLPSKDHVVVRSSLESGSNSISLIKPANLLESFELFYDDKASGKITSDDIQKQYNSQKK